MMSEISEKAKKLLWAVQDILLKELFENDCDYDPMGDSIYLEARWKVWEYIADLEAENRALRHSLELRECEEMEHKPDPLEGVQFVSLSNAEIAAMTPEHPLYKLVKGNRKCDDE